MTIHKTDLKSLVDQIRLARPQGTVYMGMYRANAKFVVPKDNAYIYGFMGTYGRNFAVVQTRYDDLEGVSVPRELIYFCLGLHDTVESAAHYLYHVALSVHSICQLSANAGSSVIQETLMTEFPFGQWRRFFAQTPV